MKTNWNYLESGSKEGYPPINEPVLCAVWDGVTVQKLVGKLKGNYWIVGGKFSFDVGIIFAWTELPETPEIPNDLL